MQTGSLRIYIDFDGTITSRDVGDSIFERFLRPDLLAEGWHEDIIREWKAGRISSRDCLIRECGNTIVTREELDGLLDEHAITPGFAQLVEYCAGNDIPLCILSDGLDYYIEFILAKFGLSDIPYHANHMVFTDTSIGVEFPYADRGCGRCANCKRWHIEAARRKDEKTVYIGDGYSDRYAIKSVNTVFACHDLAEYCDTHKIEYIPFENFHDVLKYLECDDGQI